MPKRKARDLQAIIEAARSAKPLTVAEVQRFAAYASALEAFAVPMANAYEKHTLPALKQRASKGGKTTGQKLTDKAGPWRERLAKLALSIRKTRPRASNKLIAETAAEEGILDRYDVRPTLLANS